MPPAEFAQETELHRTIRECFDGRLLQQMAEADAMRVQNEGLRARLLRDQMSHLREQNRRIRYNLARRQKRAARRSGG